jgi:hypothetical protein
VHWRSSAGAWAFGPIGTSWYVRLCNSRGRADSQIISLAALIVLDCPPDHVGASQGKSTEVSDSTNLFQIAYSCKVTLMLSEIHISRLRIFATHYRLALRSVCWSQAQSPDDHLVRPGTPPQISSSSLHTTGERITSKRGTITACHLFSCQLQSCKLQICLYHRSIAGLRVLAEKPHHGGQRVTWVNSTTRLSITTRRGPLRSKGCLTVWRWISNQGIVVRKLERAVKIWIDILCKQSMCTCSLFDLISLTPTENALGGARALAFGH